VALYVVVDSDVHADWLPATLMAETDFGDACCGLGVFREPL